ncbi:PorV/PorQ family protein [Parapedobacter sp. 10938]|uniref:PorV/PorQ family protein n=1 Tax=Parapedobacter flavus TaxID=3110225 RepID=UPI002DB83CA9|nr:PorV/PorQ family protein [Parapedobacter sp. 10938]MEC3881812.1 PorV/PorQ family protein [Parapedobacter sp. 10938]
MRKPLKHIITVAALAAASPLHAQEQRQATPTGAEFLNVNNDIKSSGMGNLRSAHNGDAFAIFSNPARVSFQHNRTMLNDVSMSYIPLVSALTKDIKLISLSTNHWVGGGSYNESYLSFGLQYLTYGDVFFTDNMGNETDYVRPREFAISATYSKRFGEYWSMGLTPKIILSRLGSASLESMGYSGNATAVAVDAGVFGKIPMANGNFNMGLVIQNVGTKLKYSENSEQAAYLPQVARLGIGADFGDIDDIQAYIGIEANLPLLPSYSEDYHVGGAIDGIGQSVGGMSGPGFAIGGQLSFIDQFSIRAGYEKEAEAFNKRSLLTAGLGINLFFDSRVISIDGAYVFPTGDNTIGMSNMYKIGLSFMIYE